LRPVCKLAPWTARLALSKGILAPERQASIFIGVPAAASACCVASGTDRSGRITLGFRSATKACSSRYSAHLYTATLASETAKAWGDHTFVLCGFRRSRLDYRKGLEVALMKGCAGPHVLSSRDQSHQMRFFVRTSNHAAIA